MKLSVGTRNLVVSLAKYIAYYLFVNHMEKIEKIKSFIYNIKKNMHDRQRYKCPNCEKSNCLLIKGPRGNGPFSREGIIKDTVEDAKDFSVKSLFDGSEKEYVNVLLECENCKYKKEKPSNDFLVDRIIEEKHGYPY